MTGPSTEPSADKHFSVRDEISQGMVFQGMVFHVYNIIVYTNRYRSAEKPKDIPRMVFL